MNVRTSLKRREYATHRKEGRSEEGQSQNRFVLLMAFLSVVFTVGYHSLAQTSGSFSSSGSGSCGSSAPGGTTPSLGGGDQGRVLERILRESLMAGHRSMPEQVGRFLGLGGDAVKAAALWSSMAQVADVRTGEEGDAGAAGMPWRVVDEVFPFEGSAEQNPHSFVYQFQIQVQYTLTPGSAVYVGGACYRNGGAQQETGQRKMTVYLHTDELLELKVSFGVGNGAQAQVLAYEYVGFQTCGSGTSGGTCGDYGLRAESGAVNLSMAIGLASPTSKRAGTKGTLRLVSEQPESALAHPNLLCYVTHPDSDVEVLRESTWEGAIRQIKGADGLLAIQRDGKRGYTLQHFPPDAVGDRGEDGFYRTIGHAYATWTLRIGTPLEASDARVVEIEQRIGNVAAEHHGVLHQYVWSGEEQGWDLVLGDGLKGDRTRTAWNDDRTIKRVTREQYNPATGKVDRHFVTVYEKLFEGGETLVKTREIANPGPEEKVTTYAYGRRVGEPGFRQLTEVVDPDGGWVRYAYDGEDRVIQKWRGFLNQRPTNDLRRCRVITYDYRALPGSRDDGSQPGLARAEIVSLLGKELGRTYRVIRGGSTWTYLAYKAGAPWRAPQNSVSRITRYSEGEFAGQLQSVSDPRGRLTTYTYDMVDDRLRTVERSGLPDQNERVRKGIETITISGRDGAYFSVKRVDIESGILIEHLRYGEHDRLGRAQRIDYADGTYELSTRSNCCGVDFERRRNGTQITYSRDALGRVTHQVSGNREERFIYDGAGAVVEWSSEDLTGRAKSRFRRERRNLAGDIVESEDGHGTTLRGTRRQRAQMTALARVLAEAPESEDSGDGRQEISVGPDGATTIHTYAADGTLLSLTGTAVHGIRYAYGVDRDRGEWRAFTKTIHLDRQGEDTQEWVALYLDSLERDYRTLYSDGSEERRWYNKASELTKSVDPDGVTTLFRTSLLGNVNTTAIDMNRNGKIDFEGIDQITRTVKDYVIQAGKDATRVQHHIWDQAGMDRSTHRLTTIVSADGLDTWQIRHLGPRQEAVTHTYKRVNNEGQDVTTTQQPDGARTEITSHKGKIRSRARSDAEGKLLERTDYEYNAIGQLVATVDGQSRITDYEYDDHGNMTAVTLPAPEPGWPRPVTRHRYDQAGRNVATIHPDGGQVLTEYWPTGEKKIVYGVRTYPVRYDYDYAGRLWKLTTWQDYARHEGRAETIWRRDNRGQVTRKIYADGTGPQYTYTPGGRLNKRVWADGRTTRYRYDAAGRLVSTTYDDETPAIERKFNRAGQLTRASDGKQTTEYKYNRWGQLTREGRQGVNAHQLIRHSDELGRPTGYTLRQEGSLVAEARYGYDAAGRIAKVGDGELLAHYEYLPHSNLVAKVTMSSESHSNLMTTTKRYDRLQRLEAIDHRTPRGVMAAFDYTYNEANQRVAVDREDGAQWRYEYDAIGQLTFGGKYQPGSEEGPAQAVPGHGFSYAFDDIGNRRHSAKLEQPFDDRDRGNTRSDYTSNNLNQYERRTVSGYAELLGQVDPRANLRAIAHSNGRPVETDIERLNETFRVTVPVDNQEASATTRIAVEASLNGATTSETTEIDTPKTPTRYQHDADGNLLRDERWHYTWNGENRLVRMRSRNTVSPKERMRLEFRYDHVGRRIEKKVFYWDEGKERFRQGESVNFVYDGWNLIAETRVRGEVSSLKTYLWGLDLSHTPQGAGGVGGLLAVRSENGPTQLPFCDGNGNIVGLASPETGELTAHYSYGPFGELLQATGRAAANNSLRFSTKYIDDETGLSYYGFRYFDSVAGRWLNRDPLEEEGGNNLLKFVLNDPINYFDPDGRILCAAYILHPGVWVIVAEAIKSTVIVSGAVVTTYIVTEEAIDVYQNYREECNSCVQNGTSSVTRTRTRERTTTKKSPYGNCTKAEHAALSAAVGATCKSQPFSCDIHKHPNLSCSEIQARIGRGQACVAARSVINNRCFNGGDSTHKTEENNARTAVSKCAARYVLECN